jgi:polysaccharide export outer membrane protein
MDQVRDLRRRARRILTRVVSTLIVVAASTFLSSCSGPTHYVRPAPAVEDNSLGPGDVFAVRVFGEQDMSQDYRVAPDGTIDFPYVGRLRVQGLAGTEVADTIRRRLVEDEILRNPQVSVYVKEINSRHILILGQVAHPGTLPFEQNMTIVQAITAAGGFTPLADQGRVRLTRRVRGGGQRSYALPVDMISEGRATNVSLAPNDIIVVPQSTF